MARSPRFTRDELLDAALDLTVANGPAGLSIAELARRTGAASGSIYHRFAGRDELLAELWLRTILEYQDGMLTALALDDTDAALTASIAYAFDWTDQHPRQTRLLLEFRAEDIVENWPESLGARLAAANDRLRAAFADFARRRFGTASRDEIDRTVFALADLPYAAIRRHLPAGRPRPWLRDFTIEAARQVLVRAEPGR